jgi:hypothetical protein
VWYSFFTNFAASGQLVDFMFFAPHITFLSTSNARLPSSTTSGNGSENSKLEHGFGPPLTLRNQVAGRKAQGKLSRMMLIRTRVAPSAIHGLGLFTVEPVPRGTPVWRFQPGYDFAITPEQFAALPAPAREHTRWFGHLDRATGNYLRSGDHACFMNHSSAPNTGAPADATAPVTTIALRDLAAGEELTCDYRAFDADVAWKLGAAAHQAAPDAR